jgi:hypothetical protein
MPEDKKPQDVKSFIDLALDRWKVADEAESESRKESMEDLRFSIGEQWSPMLKSQRQLDGRPCLTMDQIQQSLRQVCNEQRQQRPAINVNPVGNGADTDSAEIWQGIVRHIEVQSDAEIAYDTAFESMARCGRGHFRLLAKYSDTEEGVQDIFVEPIENTFCVYTDPSKKKQYLFIVEDLTHEQYKHEYPKSELAASLDIMTSTGNVKANWISKESVRVAEYYYVDEEPREKLAPKRTVKWSKINAIECLEGGPEDEIVIPGKRIPVLAVIGDDLDIDGKKYQAGMVRNAKDAQRQYNFMVSAATEAIALAPKAPYVIAEGQLEGYEKMWKDANLRNFVFLPYKPVALGDKPVGPPQREAAEPPIQAMAHMIQQAGLDLKASIGLYDPSLGQRKGDESGKAIERLQKQGDVATFNYSDNLSRTMREAGRILIDWIPVYYDTPRVQRIIKPDGTVKQVITHKGEDQAQEAAQLDPNIKAIYDLEQGTYDVTISVGPSYQTKRQEAVATQMALIQTDPNLVGIIGDLTIGQMDIPQAKEIAKRLHKVMLTVHPELADQDEDSQIQQLMAQHGQLTQQVQGLSQLLQQAQQVIETKKIEQQGKFAIEQMKSQNDFAIRKLDSDTKIAIAEINTKAQIAIERARALQEVHSDLHEAAHETALETQQQGHERNMAQMAAQQAQQQQQGDQAHEAGMAAMQQAQNGNNQ